MVRSELLLVSRSQGPCWGRKEIARCSSARTSIRRCSIIQLRRGVCSRTTHPWVVVSISSLPAIPRSPLTICLRWNWSPRAKTRWMTPKNKVAPCTSNTLQAKCSPKRTATNAGSSSKSCNLIQSCLYLQVVGRALKSWISSPTLNRSKSSKRLRVRVLPNNLMWI